MTEFMEQPEIERLTAALATCREVKDGFYEAMAMWRERAGKAETEIERLRTERDEAFNDAQNAEADRCAANTEIERLREQHDLALRVHDAMAAKIERMREILTAIAEGYPVRCDRDRFVIVENPRFTPDNGEDPNLVWEKI